LQDALLQVRPSAPEGRQPPAPGGGR